MSNHVHQIHPSLLEVIDPFDDRNQRTSTDASCEEEDEENGCYLDDEEIDSDSDENDNVMGKPNYYYTSPSLSKRKDPESEKPKIVESKNSRRSSLESIDTPPASLIRKTEGSLDNTAHQGNILVLNKDTLTEPLLSGTPPTLDQRPKSKSCMKCPRFRVSLKQQFRLSSAFILFLCIANLSLSTYYAWMSSNESQYADDDWQKCILFGIAPPSMGYNTQFSLSASASGLQVVTFSLLSLVTTYRALCHPDWLQSTIAFVFYAGIGGTCFFGFAPAIPFPSSLTANTVVLMKYVHQNMYNGVKLNINTNKIHHKGDPTSQAICRTAYNFNVLFLSVQIGCVIGICWLGIVCLLGESRRRRVGLISNETPGRSVYYHGVTQNSTKKRRRRLRRRQKKTATSSPAPVPVITVRVPEATVTTVQFQQTGDASANDNVNEEISSASQNTGIKIYGNKNYGNKNIKTPNSQLSTYFNHLNLSNVLHPPSLQTPSNPPLLKTNAPLVTSLIATVGFFMMLWGKNSTALTAIDCVVNPGKNATAVNVLPASFFPFSAGGLDVSTILFVVTVMSVIRGTTRARVSAFRLSAGAAMLHCVLSWPSVIAGWRFSDLKGFWGDQTECEDYFLNQQNWFQPDHHHSTAYCRACRICLIGQLLTLVMMHLSIIGCFRCYLANRDTPLEFYEPTEDRGLAGQRSVRGGGGGQLPKPIPLSVPFGKTTKEK